MSAFKDFNEHYLQSLPNRTLINDLSCFLNWEPDQFVINNLETLSFFRHLNDLLVICDSNSDAWYVFQIIDIAVRNRSTRQHLIDTIRIITGVSNFAVKVDANLDEEKQIRLWTFIETITNDIVIQSEEPYLTALIEYLVTAINKPSAKKILQASILTNLCFKNEIAISCLLRFVKTKTFLKSIFDIRVLWCKMAIAIARFDYSFLVFELTANLKFIFQCEYFTGLMRTKDKRLLNHILELLQVGLQGDDVSKNILQELDLQKPIEEVLTLFDNEMDVGDENIERDSSEHVNLFLGIINAALSVSNKSLQSNMQRLFNLAVDNIGTDKFSPTAIRTVRLIIANNFTAVNSTILVALLNKLLDNPEIDHRNLLAASESYQLLSTVLEKCPHAVPQDILNKSVDAELWSFKLTNDNLNMQLYRLKWFMDYSRQYEIMLPKLKKLMENKEVQVIFANGLHNSNAELCALTMTFTRSMYFPTQPVSKLLCNVVSLTSTSPRLNYSGCYCNSVTESTKSMSFSPSLEKRVDAAVEQVLTKMNNSNRCVEKKELRDILEYQTIIANAKERLLQSQLKTSSDLITNQANEIGGLKSILRLYQNNINDLELRQENLNISVDKLRAAYHLQKTKYDKKVSELTNLQATVTEMTVKNNELNDTIKRYGKKMNQLKEEIDTHSKKNIQLEKDYKKILEDEIKKSQQEILKKEGLIAITNNRLDETEKCLKKAKDDLKEYEMKLDSHRSKLIETEERLEKSNQENEAYKRQVEGVMSLLLVNNHQSEQNAKVK